MSPVTEMLLYTAGAGACMPLGGLLASAERIRPRWLETEFRHFVIAFGGGVLLAAVALVLLPQGVRQLENPWAAVACIVAGGGVFFVVERWRGEQHRETPQLLAALLDYLPESLALGGMFAAGAVAAPLLAMLIGLQNLPEGFNAYRELRSRHAPPSQALLTMALLVPLGPVLALLGWYWLSAWPQWLGAVMLFAAGGILYLVFQDIAPMARLRRHWFPPLGAVCGFAVALLGQLLIGG